MSDSRTTYGITETGDRRHLMERCDREASTVFALCGVDAVPLPDKAKTRFVLEAKRWPICRRCTR